MPDTGARVAATGPVSDGVPDGGEHSSEPRANRPTDRAMPPEAAWIESERGRPLQTKSARQIAALEALFGRRFKAVVPDESEWRDMLHPDDAARVVAALATGRETGAYETTYRIVLPDDSVRPVHDRVLLLADRWQLRIVTALRVAGDDASPEAGSASGADPSAPVPESPSLRWLDRALGEAIVRCDHAGRVTDVHGPAELSPVPPDALRGYAVADFVDLPLAMRHTWSAAVDRALDTQRAQICAYRLERDGVERAFEARVLPLDVESAVVAIRDVGERNLLRDRIERHATHDEVTGLGNLRRLREQLGAWMRPAGAGPMAAVALLIVDLDRFKQTNDLHGRSIGDSLLRLVAQRLHREALRELGGRPFDAADVVNPTAAGEQAGGDDAALVAVRIGGDQFGIAWRLPASASVSASVLQDDEAPVARSTALAERLLTALSAPTRIGGRTVFVRASIGIALYPTDATDPATLYSQAEAALRRAKAAGRNQVRRHGDGDGPDGAPRVARSAGTAAAHPAVTEAALREALASGRLQLVYQPKFELASSLSRAAVDVAADATGADRTALAPGAIIAVEALVRWRTPGGAVLTPHQFIPLAESSGAIRPLGEWVLRAALAEAGTFAARGAARVGVTINVSLLQLHDRAFLQAVEAALVETGFAPHELTVELAETSFVDDIRLAADALAELSALGVRLAIDHFGVGTAGLVALKTLPIDEVKIDRSFIAGAAIDAFDATIVSGLIGMAHDLGKTVTAEGVERIDQIASLCRMRCDAIQGYFVGEPVDADTLVALPSLWQTTRARRAPDER